MVSENCCCFACSSDNLYLVLDLGNQPLANSYLKNPNDNELVFPLRLNFCKNCTHLQLSHTVNPNLLFKNYLYVSGTSNTLREYFENFVLLTEKYVNKINNVLDIACNDGSQLAAYKNKGYNTYGIDPAENLLATSTQFGDIKCDYLTHDSINSFDIKFDVIVAQNVFAHNNYPVEFLKHCTSALSDDGCIFIQTSQANMIANNEFDTIYHEHLSFFNVRSMVTIAKRANLKLIDVLKVPVHGTSYVFVLSKNKQDCSEFFIDREPELTTNILTIYSERVHKLVADLTTQIENYRYDQYKIIGYGAAAKGNTLLNFAQLKLDYILDDNPLKHGLFTPGMHIPIVHPDTIIDETDKTLVIPLAWNFFDEIKQKVLYRNANVKFIKYFPDVVVE